MAIKRCSIIYLSSLFTIFSSELAFAAEKSTIDNSPSSIQTWPLFVLLALLIIFRKQLFAEATPEYHDEPADHTEPVAKETTKKADTAETKSKPAEPLEEKAIKEKKAKKPTNNVIDLSADNSQCQASTAKGTRCKRKTSLEQANVEIDGNIYQLTVCRQHNNDAIKPFADLIK